MFKFLNGADGTMDYSQLAGFVILVVGIGIAVKHLPIPASLKP